MNETELKEKLEKLEQYEAQERKQERLKPLRELEASLGWMRNCLARLEKAAIYQDEADEIGVEFDLCLTTHGLASIWDAHELLESQIDVKEKEWDEMQERLEREEE